MMTLGFTCDFGDVVTVGTSFILPENVSASCYIQVTGTEGKIVYLNNNNETQVAYGFNGYNLIAAIKVLVNGTVNGVLHTTAATGMYWLATRKF